MRHPGTGRLMQCARLPFGYVDSPRLFCSVTEAIAGELRKRAAGMGIHYLVFVDDFLCIGDTEELARKGGEMLEQVLAEFGLEWAPHKQRGPTQCIEFLGLLICNVEGARCIALTESRQRKVRALIDEWLARQPGGKGLLKVEPRELARLLGNLVFASQCVPGGRTYMQGMLSQFAGLEVDWRHGRVRPTRSGAALEEMTVSAAFWRDLEWWDAHFEQRNCVSMDVPTHGEAAITGTDASDWGTGQLVWLDGAREEVQLRFSQAEQRRSINWRELLGILRVFEFYGERLSGRLVLVETDNMAAKGAAAKRASNAPDMQELLRRLLEVAARHGITLRFTHTPGVKLTRPDQTSRGDPVEEPRMRVRADEFAMLSDRFGPFSEMLGAERGHRQSDAQDTGGSETTRLWMHPTYNTVGSALRMLGERLMAADGGRASGLVIVPHDEAAKWWGLTRHFAVVGRWAAGTPCLEANRLGKWTPVRAWRDTLILAFPRGAGAVARPVWIAPQEKMGTGYVLNKEGTARALPLPAGAFVYAVAPSPGAHGVLYQVWRRFSPRNAGTMYLDADGDMQAVQCAQLTRTLVTSGRRKTRAFENSGGRCVYSLNLRRDCDEKDRAFAPGVGSKPWASSAALLWTVDHLVEEVTSAAAQSEVNTPQTGVLTARIEAERRYLFDFKQAEREVARCMRRREEASLVDTAGSGIERLTLDEANGGMSKADSDGVGYMQASSQRQEQRDGMRRSRRGLGEEPLGEVMRSPQRMEARIRAAKRAGSVQAIALEIGDSAARELGNELSPAADVEAASALAEARASAEEAAGARKHPERVTLGSDRASTARLPPIGEGGRQPCKYRGMACAGCGEAFDLGEMMMQGGQGMVHVSGPCRELAERELNEATRKRREQRAERAGGELASEKRDAQLKHRFSTQRLEMLRCCLAGECGVDDSREQRIFCSKGCGQGVHAVACLQMSKHRAQLGAMVCVDCRAADMMTSSCSPSDSIKRAAGESMLLELATGKESTAAGYSDFARLEREWIAHVSGDDEGRAGSVVMPRHSAESFIAFMLWLVKDAGRTRSFGTVLRAAGGVLERLELTNWTKTPRVKAAINELEQSRGVQSTPDTHATRRILSIMLCEKLKERCGSGLLKRSTVQVVLELMGGVRVGEATGGGDGHGALADNVCIVRPVGTPQGHTEEIVELWPRRLKEWLCKVRGLHGRIQGPSGD